jgi:hypothetical protein
MNKVLPIVAMSLFLTGCLSNLKVDNEVDGADVAEASDPEYRCKRVKKTGSNMPVKQCSKIATTDAERRAAQNALMRMKMKGSMSQRKDQ